MNTDRKNDPTGGTEQELSPETESPQLAPPGAGIPIIERLVFGKLIMPVLDLVLPWHAVTGLFASTSRKTLTYIQNLDRADLQQQTLIPRLSGLEDSSRYWSIAMTLQHAVIVGTAFIHIIDELSAGHQPTIVADIAKVKPLPTADISEVQEYQQFCQDYETRYQNKPGGFEKSELQKYPHPWFGPMTASRWHLLSWLHLQLHYRQIREIGKRL